MKRMGYHQDKQNIGHVTSLHAVEIVNIDWNIDMGSLYATLDELTSGLTNVNLQCVCGSAIKVTFHCKVITLLHGLLWTQRRLLFDIYVFVKQVIMHMSMKLSAMCCFCLDLKCLVLCWKVHSRRTVNNLFFSIFKLQLITQIHCSCSL